MQTFGIVENGKVRDLTPEEIEELTEKEPGEKLEDANGY